MPEPAKDAHWNRQSADRLPPWAQSGPVAPSPAPWVLQSNVPRSRSSGKTRALGGASDESVRPCMPFTSQSAGPAQATVDLALEPRSRQPPADTNIGGGDWTVRELVSGTQTAPAYRAPTLGRGSYDHILQPHSCLCGPHCPPGPSGLFRDGRTCSPRGMEGSS